MTDCTHQELAIHPGGFATCLVCGKDLSRKVEPPVPLTEGELCLTHWTGKEHLVSYVVQAGIIRRVATRHVLVAEDGSEEPLDLNAAALRVRVKELEKATADALSGSGHHERCLQSSCEGPCNCWRSFLVDALASPAEDP